MKWFEVNKEGLAKLIEHKGKHRIIFELIQNAWDQNVTEVSVSLKPIKNKPFVEIVVTDDDPNGFENLSHAFTLFAESSKKHNPEQRGRFNLGEKLVLSLCESAAIKSTTGTIIFDSTGRHSSRTKTEKGSEFFGILRMNRDEMSHVVDLMNTLIPTVKTTINCKTIPTRTPICTFEETLPTEIADDEGFLRKTRRKTKIEIYPVQDGEQAHIYEMGIPVVETGDKYHVNIMQKVPLNTDRDNVPPSFLKDIRTLVFNKTYQYIDENEANSSWVRSATSDDKCSKEAMETAITKRFGNKTVIYDPSDPEANNKAFSLGYTVITGSQLNKQEWENLKRDSLVLPAGQVTPAKPTFSSSIPPMTEEELNEGMKEVRQYAKRLARQLLNVDLLVDFLNTKNSKLLAYYKQNGTNPQLVFYVQQLGTEWFNLKTNMEGIDALLIHEFGHQYSGNHMSHEYHDALCKLGAKLKAIALLNR